MKSIQEIEHKQMKNCKWDNENVRMEGGRGKEMSQSLKASRLLTTRGIQHNAIKPKNHSTPIIFLFLNPNYTPNPDPEYLIKNT